MDETSKKLRALGYHSAYIANYLNIRYQDYLAIKDGKATKTDFNIAEKTKELITNKTMFLANQNKILLEAKALVYSGTLYERINKISKDIIKSYTGWADRTVYQNKWRLNKAIHNNGQVDLLPNDMLVFYNIYNHHGGFNYVQRTDLNSVTNNKETNPTKVFRKKARTRVVYSIVRYDELTIEEKEWYKTFDFKGFVKDFSHRKSKVSNLEKILVKLGFTYGYAAIWYDIAKYTTTASNYILVRALYAYVHNLPMVDVKNANKEKPKFVINDYTTKQPKEVPVEVDEPDYSKMIEDKEKQVKSLKYQIAVEKNKQLDNEIKELTAELNRLRYGTDKQPEHIRESLPE